MTGEKPSTWRKPCASAALSIVNHTWTSLGSNPSLLDVSQTTNC